MKIQTLILLSLIIFQIQAQTSPVVPPVTPSVASKVAVVQTEASEQLEAFSKNIKNTDIVDAVPESKYPLNQVEQATTNLLIARNDLCLSYADLKALKDEIKNIDFNAPLTKLGTGCSLEFDDLDCFSKQSYINCWVEANRYTITGSKLNQKVSCCPKIGWMLGGYNVFGQGAVARRQYIKPANVFVNIRFDLYLLDSWDSEFFQVTVNGNNVVYSRQHNQFWFPDYPLNYKAHPYLAGESKSLPNCGWNRPNYTNFDKKIKVSLKFLHSSPLLTIKFSSTLNQDAGDESWGIRNLCIFYSTK